MDKVLSFIKRMDLFGVPISLVMNRSTHYNTLVGSFASFIGILFVIVFFRENFTCYITKSKVEYQIENIYSQFPPRLDLSQETFMFALGIEQPQQDFLTNPFFNITVIQTVYQMDGDNRIKEYANVEMEPCRAEHFKLIGKEQYMSMKILSSQKNFICPKLNQNLEVEGLYTNTRFSFLRIYITRCNQTGLNQDYRGWKPTSCGSDEYFTNYMKSVKYPKLLIYTTNFNINPTETKDYAIPYIQDQQTVQFSPYKTFKNVDLFVKHVKINTDESIIFETEGNNEEFLKFDTEETIVTQDNYIENSNQPFVQLQLRRSQNTIKIKRSYKKLAELMYQIGGLVKCIFLLFEFFVAKYNKFQYRLELANKLYDFELSTKINQKDQAGSYGQKEKSESNNSASNEQQCIDVNKNQKSASDLEGRQSIDFNQNNLEKKESNNLKAITHQLISTASGIGRTFMDYDESPYIQKKDNLKKSNSQERFQEDQIINEQVQDQNKCVQIQLNNEVSIQKIKEIKQNNSIENIKDQLSQYFQQIISRAQRMKSSFTYFLNFMTFRKFFNTEQNYLIRKAHQFTKRDLDIYVILDKLQEIEKLKKIMLDEEQLSIFNFFPKPIIRKQQKLFQNKSFRDLNMQRKMKKKNNNSSKSSCSSCSSSSANLSGDNLLKEREDFTTVEAYQVNILPQCQLQNYQFQFNFPQNLYQAYQYLKRDSREDHLKINNKLFQELGNELLTIFNKQQENQNENLKLKQIINARDSLKSDKIITKNQNRVIIHNKTNLVSNDLRYQQQQIQQSFLNNNESLNYQLNQVIEMQEVNKLSDQLSNQVNGNQVQLKESKSQIKNVEIQSNSSLFHIENQNNYQCFYPEVASENNRTKPCLDFNFIKLSRLHSSKPEERSNIFETKSFHLNGIQLDIKSLSNFDDKKNKSQQ